MSGRQKGFKSGIPATAKQGTGKAKKTAFARKKKTGKAVAQQTGKKKAAHTHTHTHTHTHKLTSLQITFCNHVATGRAGAQRKELQSRERGKRHDSELCAP